MGLSQTSKPLELELLQRQALHVNATTLQSEWVGKWNASPLAKALWAKSLPNREFDAWQHIELGLTPGGASESSSSGESCRPDRRGPTLFLAPGFVPLRALCHWFQQNAEGTWRIWSPAGELIALIRHESPSSSSNDAPSSQSPSNGESKDFRLEDDEVLTVKPSGGRGLLVQDAWWSEPSHFVDELKFANIAAVGELPTESMLPLEILESEPGPIGSIARATFKLSEPVKETVDRLSAVDIDVIAVTTDRFSSVRELLKSIRNLLPGEIAVTIVVQAPSSIRWRNLARKFKADLIHVESDTGLAACRNFAVDSTQRKLIFLMDDDFALDDRCRLDDALQILDANQDLAVLGGNLLDVETWKSPRKSEISQGFAMHMIRGDDRVVWLRVEDAPRVRNFVNPVDYFEECDIVDNFALMRRDRVFGEGVYWNPALKIGAEHQDLYIRLKAKSDARVARTNALKVRNVRVQNRRYKFMRNRVDKFFEIFFRDLGIKSFSILGERLRAHSPDGASVYMEQPGMRPIFPPSQAQK